MERIFSQVKIFVLKKIVFPVLQIIAKYKAKKKVEKKAETKYSVGEYIVTKIPKNENETYINYIPKNLTPKEYGERLQQTGKQIWVKKQK